jgi:hypothetical protein
MLQIFETINKIILIKKSTIILILKVESIKNYIRFFFFFFFFKHEIREDTNQCTQIDLKNIKIRKRWKFWIYFKKKLERKETIDM